jgi:hypothetical protein
VGGLLIKMVKCNKKKELKIGTKIEMEHSKIFPKNLQSSLAKKIAADHIKEFPCYYSKGLIPLEKKLRRKK